MARTKPGSEALHPARHAKHTATIRPAPQPLAWVTPRFASFTWMMQGSMGLLTQEDVENIGADLPRDTSALILLFEHRWAVPLREAIERAGGMPLADEWVHPSDLVAAGAVAARTG